jgi:hypothetical protein
MHRDCYEAWAEQSRFARAWIDFWVRYETGCRVTCKAYLDEFVFISLNRHNPNDITLGFFASGGEYKTSLDGWAAFLAEPEPTLGELTPFERETIVKALPALRKHCPTAESLLNAVDRAGKEALDRQEEAAQAEQREQRINAFAPYNAACKIVLQRLARESLACPQCGHSSQDVRFIEAAPDAKSYFRCKRCLGSFGPADERASRLYGPIIGTTTPFPSPTDRKR